jgi:hypothetical protein
MRCAQCSVPLGFGLYRYCSNECQQKYHIENNTNRAKEMRGYQNSSRVCFDWNLGRECTPFCGKYGWRHACQKCGTDCSKGEGKHGCARCSEA